MFREPFRGRSPRPDLSADRSEAATGNVAIPRPGGPSTGRELGHARIRDLRRAGRVGDRFPPLSRSRPIIGKPSAEGPPGSGRGSSLQNKNRARQEAREGEFESRSPGPQRFCQTILSPGAPPASPPTRTAPAIVQWQTRACKSSFPARSQSQWSASASPGGGRQIRPRR